MEYPNAPFYSRPFRIPLQAKYATDVVTVTTKKWKMSPQLNEWLRRQSIAVPSFPPVELDEAAKYGWIRYYDATRGRRDWPKPTAWDNFRWHLRCQLTKWGLI